MESNIFRKINYAILSLFANHITYETKNKLCKIKYIGFRQQYKIYSNIHLYNIQIHTFISGMSKSRSAGHEWSAKHLVFSPYLQHLFKNLITFLQNLYLLPRALLLITLDWNCISINPTKFGWIFYIIRPLAFEFDTPDPDLYYRYIHVYIRIRIWNYF